VYLGAALGTGLAGDEALRVFMAMVAPYIVLSTVVKTPLVFMQAQREIRRASLFTAVTQVVSLVMLVGATWTWGLWGFFATVIAAPLTNLGILLVATRRDLRWTGWPWGRVRKLVGFGIPSMLANTVGFANGAAAVVLLKHLTGSDEWVGLYSIGLVMMSGARLLPSALMGTAFPYLSGLLNDPARFRTRMRELSLKQGAVLLLSAVAWFLVGRQAIIWVFGARFEDAFWSSLILVAGLVPFGLGAPYGNGLMILGRVGLNLLVSTLQLAVNVGLLLVLIPGHPLEGAAWAVSAAQGVGGAATIVAAWWALGKVRPTAPVLPGG
jgi:O-antigen/teichoic acid export membrane protein